jgi:hypothetical protein
MRKQVIFRDRQELQAADLTNVQEYGRSAFDGLVADAVTGSQAYAGFLVTQATATEISVAPGRYYKEGRVYLREASVAINLFAYLPLVTKKVMAVAVWGQEIETDVQPRDFLIDAETGETEPQSVAMQRLRFAEVNVVAGQESASPLPPGVDASQLAIAHVVLGTTGIESVSMAATGRLPSVGSNAVDIDGLEAFRASAEPKIAALTSALAEFQSRLDDAARYGAIAELAAYVARLKELAELPDNAASYGADRFLSDDETDTGDLTLDARIEEGVRFAWDNQDEGELALFSATPVDVVNVDGLVLPKYTSAPRIQVTTRVDEPSVAQYQQQTFDLVRKSMSRRRLRWGPTRRVCTNSRWWRSGQYDPVSQTFRKDGETFQVLEEPRTHHWVRVQQFWEDTITVHYWDVVTTTVQVQGAQIAQTFLNGQDGWCTKIGLFFTQVGPTGAVHIALTETDRGQPAPGQALAVVTVPRADLVAGGEETVVTIPPTYLQAGRRYAWVLTTGGDHYAGVAAGSDFTQGTLFCSTDGVYFQGDLTRDLRFKVTFARFAYPRVVKELQPLSLDGGIADIDLLAEMVVPDSTELSFEVRPPCGAWVPLNAVTAQTLVTLPPPLHFRVVFVGTTDVMPGLRVAGSRVLLSRPRTTLRHVATERTLATPSDTIQVKVRLEAWDEALHDLEVRIHDGTGEVAASSVTDVAVDAETIERVADFAVGAPIGAYTIILVGSTATALAPFHVAERVDLSF